MRPRETWNKVRNIFFLGILESGERLKRLLVLPQQNFSAAVECAPGSRANRIRLLEALPGLGVALLIQQRVAKIG